MDRAEVFEGSGSIERESEVRTGLERRGVPSTVARRGGVCDRLNVRPRNRITDIDLYRMWVEREFIDGDRGRLPCDGRCCGRRCG